MSSNSPIDNYKKALSWASEHHAKNPNGNPPFSWFWGILAIIIVIILFGVYIKFFAVWETPKETRFPPLKPIDISKNGSV